MKVEVNSERWLLLEDFPGEIWRKIENSEEYGVYFVSNYGRVKRMPFFGGRYHFPEMIFRQHLSRKNGYYKVRVAGKMYYAHKLVALAFIQREWGCTSIDHRNGIKTDNRAKNLRWVTCKQNANNPITKWERNKAFNERFSIPCPEPKESLILIHAFNPVINLSKGIIPLSRQAQAIEDAKLRSNP